MQKGIHSKIGVETVLKLLSNLLTQSLQQIVMRHRQIIGAKIDFSSITCRKRNKVEKVEMAGLEPFDTRFGQFIAQKKRG